MSLKSGERQVAPKIDRIRRDHVARYEWAAKTLPPKSHVIDLGCGVGYGVKILADAGHTACGVDCDKESIAYARRHYRNKKAPRRTVFSEGDASELQVTGAVDAVTCFEVIEHLADPLPVLLRARELAPVLLVSVPNEDVFPYRAEYSFHRRHYKRHELVGLLLRAGFTVEALWGQEGVDSEVGKGVEGRTLIAQCRRIESQTQRPDHIAIVALGPTSALYMDAAKKAGNRKRFADFVISVNAMGSVIHSDLVFHMDDVRIQERRAAANPGGNIAGLVEWLKTYKGRVMTGRGHPDYPHFEEFPLEDVLNRFGGGYINGTGAAALAYAIYLEPKEISLWGFDFTYPNAHKNEKGRACVEYWLGRAQERGILIGLPPSTSLMDSYEDSASDEARIYGYDTMKVQIAPDPATGKFVVTKTPRPEEEWPTAEQVEAAYDHGKHPNAQGMAQCKSV